MSSTDGELDPQFRLASTSAEANEWALVLTSAGIPSRVVRVPQGFALQVHRGNAARAEAELRAYAEEDAEREAARAAAVPIARHDLKGPAPLASALLVSLAMLLFYSITGPSRPDVAWFTEGSAHAQWMRAGQLWRAVTALTLHADFVHLAANALFGTFFLAAVGRSLGPGVGFGLVLLAGTIGNLLNAFLRSGPHISIGASTAVFGAVGVLSGFGIARRAQRGDRWRLVLAPFAGGLGVLAMIGTGEGRVDVFAHLFGLLAGVGLGLFAGLGIARPPGAWVQTACFALGALALVWSWSLALA